MEKSILAARRSPLRNKVREPAGFPTPFRGWAYPVLYCAGVVCGRKPSANWGRALPFPLPLTQSGSLRASRHPFGGGLTRSYSVQGLCAAAYRVQIGEGLCPSPCPHPSQEGCGPPDTYRGVSEGERSEPGGRAFELAVGREATGVRAFGAANKPNGTPARRKAGWRGGSSISRPKHRSSSKSWFGAEIGEGLPPSPRRQPLSPARRRTAPLTQGSQRQYSGAARRESF